MALVAKGGASSSSVQRVGSDAGSHIDVDLWVPGREEVFGGQKTFKRFDGGTADLMVRLMCNTGAPASVECMSGRAPRKSTCLDSDDELPRIRSWASPTPTPHPHLCAQVLGSAKRDEQKGYLLQLGAKGLQYMPRALVALLMHLTPSGVPAALHMPAPGGGGARGVGAHTPFCICWVTCQEPYVYIHLKLNRGNWGGEALRTAFACVRRRSCGLMGSPRMSRACIRSRGAARNERRLANSQTSVAPPQRDPAPAAPGAWQPLAQRSNRPLSVSS